MDRGYFLFLILTCYDENHYITKTFYFGLNGFFCTCLFGDVIRSIACFLFTISGCDSTDCQWILNDDMRKIENWKADDLFPCGIYLLPFLPLQMNKRKHIACFAVKDQLICVVQSVYFML